MLEIDNQLTRIYDSIQTYKVIHGYSPSHDEIASALGIPKGLVAQSMDEMEALGMIVQPRGLLKAIKLLSRQPNPNYITTQAGDITEINS